MVPTVNYLYLVQPSAGKTRQELKESGNIAGLYSWGQRYAKNTKTQNIWSLIRSNPIDHPAVAGSWTIIQRASSYLLATRHSFFSRMVRIIRRVGITWGCTPCPCIGSHHNIMVYCLKARNLRGNLVEEIVLGKSETSYVDFVGCYSRVTLEANDTKSLFLGGNNTLYYPSEAVTVNSFRGYFELQNGLTAGSTASPIRAINLNFDDDTNSISTIHSDSESVEGWYSIDGRRLNEKPEAKGMYIHGGQKVMIK